MNIFVVRSEGGLGAQIVAASAYFFLKSIGCKVLMDLSYFTSLSRSRNRKTSSDSLGLET